MSKEIEFDTVQSQLEDIAFKKKKRCSYARNPFSNECVRASSQDVIQHDFNNKDGTRKLPDGRGTLETLTGQVVYKGEWREGGLRTLFPLKGKGGGGERGLEPCSQGFSPPEIEKP